MHIIEGNAAVQATEYFDCNWQKCDKKNVEDMAAEDFDQDLKCLKRYLVKNRETLEPLLFETGSDESDATDVTDSSDEAEEEEEKEKMKEEKDNDTTDNTDNDTADNSVNGDDE